MKKLVFCDIDGTILDGSRRMETLTPETKHAIRCLKENGYVIIASGRCMGILDEQIRDLDPSGYILCNGGYALIGNRTVFSSSFDPECVDRIKEVTIRNRGFYVFETLNEAYADPQDSEAFRIFMNGWGHVLHGFQENSELKDPYHIAMIGFDNEESCRKVEEELKDIVDLARHRHHLSYDVNIKGINKGTAAGKIISYLNIPYENTYCFGDGINDLEILQAVAHPVIMKNCDAALRDYGFEETGDVLENGFYSYLLANKLINPL